jgi:acetylornithine deacetylase/succinyl-diaminopimelate desuccinylase-like protein
VERILLALVLVGLTLLSLLPLLPPRVVGATASRGTFSAERARPDLAAVASEPRPMGSPAHSRVRRHLVERLRQIGVEPDERSHTLVWREGAEARAAVVHNVAARLAGTAPTGSVLLAAHYDSVPGSPGAGDNGVAVAALLETLRALRELPPPRNDVIFLFSDGEEQGLLGAQAFVAEHPWSRSVRVVLNFEARGREERR